MMKSRKILILVISLSILVENTQSILYHRNEKIAKFRVYLHDLVNGTNATVLEVARANITSTSPTSYGLVRVMDDLMTVEPNADSENLGRSQGLIANTDMEESSLSVNVNFVFTGGMYKGSTLCIIGRKSLVYSNVELPIVGGTGVFRWARGFTISNTYSHDATTGNSILQYDFYVDYGERDPGNRLMQL